MLFYMKRRTSTALLTLLALLLVANLWALLRSIDLGAAISFDATAILFALLGIVFIFSLDSLIYMVNWFIGLLPFLRRFDHEMGSVFAHVGSGAILAGALLAALGEESLFRGVLQHEWGLVPAALLFALAHAGRGLRLLATWAILQGLIFGWLYAASGNLLVPMLVHGAHDLFGMIFARYLYARIVPPAPTLFDWLRALNRQ